MNIPGSNSNLLIDDRIALGAFDFDGNILAPETPIYVLDRKTGEEIALSGHHLDQHPELISGPEAPYRWHDDLIDSLIHFRDYHSDPRHRGPDRLKEDIEMAIKQNSLAPSFSSLKEIFLIPARFLCIITSRGHGPDNLARILWIINEMLLSEEEKILQQKNIESLFSFFENTAAPLSRDQALRYYFEQIVSYYPISNPHVAKYLGIHHITAMSKRKTEAMKHAIHHIESRFLNHPSFKKYPLSIGFSDDSLGNILAMKETFESMNAETQKRKHYYHLYFTGKKEDYSKLKNQSRETEEHGDMLIIKI